MKSSNRQTPAESVPTILIVDDEQSNRLLLERAFRHGYRTVSASSGSEALKRLDFEEFDVMLLDIMMPNMDGLTVLKAVREQRELDALPIILLTALSDSDDVVNGMQLGANDYVTKPFSLDVLQARVNTQIRLKRLTDEHRRVITELNTLQNMRTRFFRMATHDLKAPIANLRMAEYLLRDTCANVPDALVLLDTISMTVRTMENVVGDFLELAVLQGGKVKMNLEEAPTEPILWDLVREYNGWATEKQIALDVEYAEGIVYADIERVKQILGNLVSNAIKYSPSDTTVRLAAQQRGEFIRFTVADEGPGIPEKEHDLLFTEFGKLSTRPTAGESSTGLGLWSVKQLVSLQGGNVGVDCPSEGGSIFWVDLPAHLEASPVLERLEMRQVAAVG